MGPRHVNLKGRVSSNPLSLYDKWLFISVLLLLSIGLLMVASSSIVISEKHFHTPFHYLFRQLFYLVIGFAIGMMVVRIESKVWFEWSGSLLLLTMLLLLLVLIPGIGHSVNGSYRWLGVGPVRFQVSEFAKLAMVMYMAGFLVRRQLEVQTQLSGFIKPMLVLAIVSMLLLREPDFGAVVVITCTALAMMFVAGVKLRQFLMLLFLVLLFISILAVSSPYRLARLTSFLNPWANQFDGGYQLTQSLIAFGRGGLTGLGLGESVQKLFYLPEAHTDFLFAVLAEEFGLVGIMVTMLLFAIVCIRGLMIGRYAELKGQFFAAYLAYGLTFWITFQAMINVGVNAGLLPTKGLTLPLMSSGGSSMLVSCIAVAILLRIDHENRWHVYD